MNALLFLALLGTWRPTLEATIDQQTLTTALQVYKNRWRSIETQATVEVKP